MVGRDLAVEEAPDLLAKEIVIGGEERALQHGINSMDWMAPIDDLST
jgi:hypothetical protein